MTSWIVAVGAGCGLGLIVAAVGRALSMAATIDFHLFYDSAVAWRAGADLYQTSNVSPNLNPPQFIVAFVPVTWLALKPALAVWSAVNLAAAVALAAIVWRELALPVSFVAVASGVAIAGLSYGVTFGLEEGQPIGVLALASTAAWAAARRNRWTTAAIVIGLLISIKPFFASLLIVPMVRRDWRTLAWSTAASLSALAAGVLLAGPQAFVRWIEVGRRVTWFAHPMNAAVVGVVWRANLPNAIAIVCVAAIVILTTVAVRRPADIDVAWLLCGMAALLVGPLGWIYYLPLLAGPLTAAAVRRPALIIPGCAFLWPIPAVIGHAPITPLTAVTLFSLPTWALLAMWMLAARHCMLAGSLSAASFCPAPVPE